ncbi:MAG: hypothetical protein LH618_06215, partial [Saprospiraceae bacterium]|nr:hypothetical protein [Saprospiraceae bacterium]
MRSLGFLLTVLGVALSMQTAFAVTRTWIGNTSQYWDVPANWSGIAVPLATDEVVIPAVVPGFSCVIRTAVTRTTTTVSDGSLNIDATGTLTNSSTISFNNQGGFVITSGGTLNNSVGGTLTMNDNNSSGLYNSGGTINNAGTITVSSITYAWNEGTIANTGTFTNNGAYFGTGTFQSSTFVNPAGGNVGIPPALGPLVDCIAFNNGFTNNGTVIFDLGAGAACTGFDRITVTGLATLGGTFTASGTVSLGNTFVVMTYSSRSGTFSNSNVNLGGGMFANISYTATQATLTIGSAPLPVELLRFEASTKEGKNQLIWATASEVNAKAFDIERSADGRAFASLRQIEAA